jgi:hypothetical protein
MRVDACEPLRPRVLARFESETAEHQLTILRDDGLYRHLRCQAPGTWIYGFDVVTWPGYLAIVGDAGDYVFSRLRDMFEFFEGSGRVNPDYWSEKLQAPRPAGAESYSHDRLRERVLQWGRSRVELDELYPYDGYAIYPALMVEALEREILYGWTHSEHEGRERLVDIEEYTDCWEWDLREYDHQFLWCCHAIVWAIERYRVATCEAALA